MNKINNQQSTINNQQSTINNQHIALAILLIFITLSPMSQAASCLDSRPNTTLTVDTTNEICIGFSGLNSSNTYLVADSSISESASYRVRVYSDETYNLLDETVTTNGRPASEKLGLGRATYIKVRLTPTTTNTSYKFYVLHDEDIATGTTTLYIGLDASPYFKESACNDEQGRVQICGLEFNSFGSLSGDTQQEAAQCNENNRPPQSSPTNEETGETLNVNSLLRESARWMNEINSDLSKGAAFAAAFARLIVMHESGGALDLAHNENSDWNGSFSMGNFLFGANAKAMGFSDFALERMSAAYTPISEGGWSNLPEALWNAVTNSGDGDGDLEEVLRGARYADEVFKNNQSDSRSLSCTDQESIDHSNNSQNGGNTGSGGGGPGGNGNSDGENESDGPTGPGGGGGSVEACYRELSDGNGSTYILIVPCP